ncbi:asparaginase [Deinococcus maricopensis]|uniref:Asparaginase n=1 Tax=Deinococcus maricopensis (strain DSM 21211 / LMG 22137 / NRRL B-23946 / LB-34) TaxID=709986 RepID=E8U3Y0_DEIML|nr:asparaginase [Deinococcus maricopensis]ADV65674.1 Asparaginase [Deinococcus maricopensis DSM 21211]
MPRLALINTGGTIASRPDPGGAGLTPQTPPQLQGLPDVDVTTFQPFTLPSPHVTPQHMHALRALIEREAQHFDGVVVTHGTDTLEETAFFLHLTLGTHTPVVLTGSMRHAEELSWDGPGNLLDAAQVALHPATQGRGPLAVFGGDVFDARTVTKVHTTAVDAFGGYPGPIGRIDHGPHGAELRYFARPETRPVFGPDTITARVEILYAYAGWQGEGFAEAAARAQGLVIAALGTGNLPPELLPLIQESPVPVVIATRTHAGPVLPVYGYAGGGATLVRAGAVPASFLNAHKARLLLMILLSLGAGRDEIARVFRDGAF